MRTPFMRKWTRVDVTGRARGGLLISWLKVRVLRGSPGTSGQQRTRAAPVGAASLFMTRWLAESVQKYVER